VGAGCAGAEKAERHQENPHPPHRHVISSAKRAGRHFLCCPHKRRFGRRADVVDHPGDGQTNGSPGVLAPAATKGRIQGDQIGQPRQARADQRLLRGIECPLCIESIQIPYRSASKLLLGEIIAPARHIHQRVAIESDHPTFPERPSSPKLRETQPGSVSRIGRFGCSSKTPATIIINCKARSTIISIVIIVFRYDGDSPSLASSRFFERAIDTAFADGLAGTIPQQSRHAQSSPQSQVHFAENGGSQAHPGHCQFYMARLLREIIACIGPALSLLFGRMICGVASR